ncbi:hypothetical protein VTG60DRAFT_380 [Thermothelomyces hinnuleus]
MSLPQTVGISSSTLGRSRPNLRTQRSLPPPPPEEIARYEKRPLPPLPSRRNSVLSAFSKEVDEALATPEPVVSPDEGTIYLIFCDETLPGDAHAEIGCQADTCLDKNRHREELRIDTGLVRSVGSDTPSFPQPQSKLQLHGGVSPLSDDSGDYSPGESRTAVSDVDGDAEGYGWNLSSGAAWDYLGSSFSHRRSIRSSAVPSPLRVTKPPKPSSTPERELSGFSTYDEHSSRLVPSPRIENERGGLWRDTPSTKPTLDMHLETVKQLSQGDCWAAQQAQSTKQAHVTTLQVPQAKRASHASDHHRFGVEHLPPPQHRVHRQPEHSSNIRPSWSTEQLGPAWRPTAVHGTPGAVNASTFGGRIPQQQQKSILPSPSRSSSGPRSRFSWDSDTSPHDAVGSPETGGSISISTGSSDMSGDARSNTSARHHRRHHSSGIMTKVFHRASSNCLTTPPPPPSSQPNSNSQHQQQQQQQQQLPSCHFHPQHDVTQQPSRASQHHFQHPGPSPAVLKTKSSMSALVTKTTDLVDAAAEFWNRSAASVMDGTFGGGKRRKRKLKSSIRVLGDGGQLLAPKSS